MERCRSGFNSNTPVQVTNAANFSIPAISLDGAEIGGRHDPGNQFRLNRNIQPAV